MEERGIPADETTGWRNPKRSSFQSRRRPVPDPWPRGSLGSCSRRKSAEGIAADVAGDEPLAVVQLEAFLRDQKEARCGQPGKTRALAPGASSPPLWQSPRTSGAGFIPDLQDPPEGLDHRSVVISPKTGMCPDFLP